MTRYVWSAIGVLLFWLAIGSLLSTLGLLNLESYPTNNMSLAFVLEEAALLSCYLFILYLIWFDPMTDPTELSLRPFIVAFHQSIGGLLGIILIPVPALVYWSVARGSPLSLFVAFASVMACGTALYLPAVAIDNLGRNRLHIADVLRSATFPVARTRLGASALASAAFALLTLLVIATYWQAAQLADAPERSPQTLVVDRIGRRLRAR